MYITVGLHLDTDVAEQVCPKMLGYVDGPVLIRRKEVGHALEGIEVLHNGLLHFNALIVLGDLMDALDDRYRVSIEIGAQLLEYGFADGGPCGGQSDLP